MSEKRFVIHDSSVEEYVESLEVSFGFYLSSFAFYEAALVVIEGHVFPCLPCLLAY